MKHEPILTRRAFLGMKESDRDFYTRKHDEACACDNHELAGYYSAQLVTIDSRPFVYHTEHDGDIVFEDTTTARSSQPVVTSEHAGNFTRT